MLCILLLCNIFLTLLYLQGGVNAALGVRLISSETNTRLISN